MSPHGRRRHASLTSRHPLSFLIAVLVAVTAMLLASCSSSSSSSSSSSTSGGSGAAGAAGASGASTTPIVIGETSALSNQDPLNSSWSLTAAGVSESTYMLDAQGNLQSRFIDTVTQTGTLDWTLTVKQGVTFSDGTPVDANAIATALNTIQQKNPLSNASAGVITFTPKGTTIAVHTARPTKVLESVLGEWTNIIFKQVGSKDVFTGPYVITALDPGTSVSLAPNPYYPDAARRPKVTIKAFADTDAMKLALQSKAIDMAFTVTPAVADQLRGVPGITTKTIDAGYQYFGMFNLTHAVVADAVVRKAVDLDLDRTAYVTALEGGRPATGLFAHYYSFAGKESTAADPAAAAKALDAAGWVKGSDGIRVKDGKRLSLSLVTYSMRPDLSIIMQIAASQLKQLGVDVKTTVVDNISTTLKAGDFDLAFYAQHTAPTGEPSFYLNQFFRTGGANNFMKYSSKTTDAMLDTLDTLAPGAARDAQAQAIQHQLKVDLPVLFLVDPQWHIAVSDRLASYQPYCGDYYVVNAALGLS